MALLKAIDISKSYFDADRTLEVLTGLDLSVGKGETIAITGESGCGKSTLLHLLGLLDKPVSGEILYSDKRISPHYKQIAEFRNKSIGFVFQFHYLLEDFTACENVAIPHLIATGDWTKSLEKAKQLLIDVDMKRHLDQYPNQLSGGEQQRVAVSRALINNPQVILADEPTGNLDPRHSDEIIDLIIRQNEKENSSLVIVTHSLDIASKMNTHYILENGQLTRQS